MKRKLLRIYLWFKMLFYMIEHYDRDKRINYQMLKQINDTHEKVCGALQLIRQQTEVSMNVSPSSRDQNLVVVIGRYRNRDYVELYGFYAQEFTEVIEHINQLKKRGRLHHVDVPVAVRAVVEKEQFRF